MEDTKLVLELILLVATLCITVYAQFSPYLNDFWKGFSIAAVLVSMPMLVANIYLARRKQTEPDIKKRITFGCSNCQEPIYVYAPSDSYSTLLLKACDEGDSIEFRKNCPRCKTMNVRYWDRYHVGAVFAG